jgi:hypothetical protein
LASLTSNRVAKSGASGETTPYLLPNREEKNVEGVPTTPTVLVLIRAGVSASEALAAPARVRLTSAHANPTVFMLFPLVAY